MSPNYPTQRKNVEWATRPAHTSYDYHADLPTKYLTHTTANVYPPA